MAQEYKLKQIIPATMTFGNTQVPGYEVVHEAPDGTLHVHAMPAYVFEARAIEYGMDVVRDFDALFDMVVHEPFVRHDEHDDPAAEAGYVTTIKGQETRATLFTAETIQDAREAHLLRVERVKERHASMSDPEGIRHQVRDKIAGSKSARGFFSASPVAPELAGLAERVAQERKSIRGRADGKPLKNKET